MGKRLKKLKKFYRRCHRLPSYSEMLKIFNFSSKNSVFRLVQKLIEEGFLKKEFNKIVPAKKFFALPLLGTVKAGFPILAEENRDYLSLDDYLFDKPESSFLLKVSGDSMDGVGIFDGDMVIIEKKKDVLPETIVLAQIDGGWTIKILKKGKKKYFLKAANPNYPDFIPVEELQIFGVIKAVIRKFN